MAALDEYGIDEIMRINNKPKLSGKQEVDQYLDALEHPYKAEILLLRSIIINANDKIKERIKWNSPSFYYIKDMAAFNLRAKGYIQIIFVFYDDKMITNSPILQGDWKDRREARFIDLADIEIKKAALEKVVNDWLKLIT